jgi:multidrug resistance efflux pump
MKGFHWALCALLVGACSVDTAPTPLVGTLERDRLELVAEANEEIIELRVAEGDLVSEGQLLMRLESAVKKAELQAAEAVRERAAQRVAELIRGPREERIRAAQARLGGAQDNLEIQRSAVSPARRISTAHGTASRPRVPKSIPIVPSSTSCSTARRGRSSPRPRLSSRKPMRVSS